MDSPFIYQKPVEGKAFIARHAESDALAGILRSGGSAIICEPPKSGKTSLIRHAIQLLRSQGEAFAYAEVNMMTVRTSGAFAHKLAEALTVAFADMQETMEDADAAQMLSLACSTAASKGMRLILVLDEFHCLDSCEDGDDVMRGMEKVMQEMPQVQGKPACSLVFCGGQVNAMKEIFRHRKRFWRQAEQVLFAPVDEKDFVEHVLRGFITSGKVMDRKLIGGACEMLKCNLWYLNHFISICDSLSKGYIMEPALAEALDKLVAVHEPRFVETMYNLTTFQVNLLRAVVDGVTRFSSSEIIEKYGLNSSANVRRLKDALCKKEIITFTDEDEPVILDPLFDWWVRNRYFNQ